MKQDSIDKEQEPFIPLTREEERILEMYSRGETYEVIQENLLIEYNMKYTGKKLGQKMGHIKEKMRCATQFEMGYLYGRRENAYDMLTLKGKHELEVIAAEKKGYAQCKEEFEIFMPERKYHKGINLGLVSASVFWLILYALIENL